MRGHPSNQDTPTGPKGGRMDQRESHYYDGTTYVSLLQAVLTMHPSNQDTPKAVPTPEKLFCKYGLFCNYGFPDTNRPIKQLMIFSYFENANSIYFIIQSAFIPDMPIKEVGELIKWKHFYSPDFLEKLCLILDQEVES